MTETNRIELKQQLTDSLEKEVIAFLNYKEGGAIYIGIDKQGVAVGVPEPSAVDDPSVQYTAVDVVPDGDVCAIVPCATVKLPFALYVHETEVGAEPCV